MRLEKKTVGFRPFLLLCPIFFYTTLIPLSLFLDACSYYGFLSLLFLVPELDVEGAAKEVCCYLLSTLLNISYHAATLRVL